MFAFLLCLPENLETNIFYMGLKKNKASHVSQPNIKANKEISKHIIQSDVNVPLTCEMTLCCSKDYFLVFYYLKHLWWKKLENKDH